MKVVRLTDVDLQVEVLDAIEIRAKFGLGVNEPLACIKTAVGPDVDDEVVDFHGFR